MKILEKRLPIGKWRLTLGGPDIAGHVIETVGLKGSRDRPVPMMKVSAKEFAERSPFDVDGNPVEPAAIMRAVPIMWFNKGNQIYLWPAPAQEWVLQITMKPRNEVVLT